MYSLFFPQHLWTHKIGLMLETESSARKKNPTVWYLLWRVQERHPTREAIKVGNQQAEATNANEMPLWNHFTVFRNYNKWDDFSLAAKIRYHKHYSAKAATQSLKKIQKPQQQLGH